MAFSWNVNTSPASPPHAARTPDGCEECLKLSSGSVHLRLCLVRGHVGCCDSSPHKHATKHFHATAHPVMASFEPGEGWGWGYVDQAQIDVPAEFGQLPWVVILFEGLARQNSQTDPWAAEVCRTLDADYRRRAVLPGRITPVAVYAPAHRPAADAGR